MKKQLKDIGAAVFLTLAMMLASGAVCTLYYVINPVLVEGAR